MFKKISVLSICSLIFLSGCFNGGEKLDPKKDLIHSLEEFSSVSSYNFDSSFLLSFSNLESAQPGEKELAETFHNKKIIVKGAIDSEKEKVEIHLNFKEDLTGTSLSEFFKEEAGHELSSIDITGVVLLDGKEDLAYFPGDFIGKNPIIILAVFPGLRSNVINDYGDASSVNKLRNDLETHLNGKYLTAPFTSEISEIPQIGIDSEFIDALNKLPETSFTIDKNNDRQVNVEVSGETLSAAGFPVFSDDMHVISFVLDKNLALEQFILTTESKNEGFAPSLTYHFSVSNFNKPTFSFSAKDHEVLSYEEAMELYFAEYFTAPTQ